MRTGINTLARGLFDNPRKRKCQSQARNNSKQEQVCGKERRARKGIPLKSHRKKKAPKSQLLLNQSATSTTSKENTPIISLVLAQMLPNAAKKTLVWLGKSPEGKKNIFPQASNSNLPRAAAKQTRLTQLRGEKKIKLDAPRCSSRPAC